jgi:hypothetical protein
LEPERESVIPVTPLLVMLPRAALPRSPAALLLPAMASLLEACGLLPA